MKKLLTAKLNISFNGAVKKTRETLANHGFGIITEIDVKETIKKKLAKDFKNYTILGACNPQFAHRAIEADDNVGLLLPCNVVVYETDDGIMISTLRPTHALNILENKTVCRVGAEAETILESVFFELNE